MINLTTQITFNNLGRIAPPLRDEFTDLQRQAAGQVAELWSADVRVRTGAYRDNITAEDGDAYTTTPYAVFNEYGTRLMAARPSAADAARAVQPRFVSEAQALVRRSVQRNGK